MTLQKKDIRTIEKEEIGAFVSSINEKTFRTDQIYEWLWKQSAIDFDQMTNLSKSLREDLNSVFIINKLELDVTEKSIDGTIKVRFKLFDGQKIEGVIIPTAKRLTACISSQVGCSLACKFCATGFMDMNRNLLSHEIYDQVVILNNLALKNFDRPLSNIVFMGMGEPLLNYKNVVKGIHYLTSDEGLGISSKRITVSTAGINKIIRKLADDKVKFNLAVSLHAANDEVRSRIMPINKTNDLNTLIDSLRTFYSATGNKITFEYILLKGVNDSQSDADDLISICKKVPSKVNIIEYNPVPKVQFSKSEDSTLESFSNYLDKNRVNVRVRRSRGKDINAACGQLANKS